MRSLAAALLALALVGCASRQACPSGSLEAPSPSPAFVVVRSDYLSSALGLLAADGSVITEDWVDSGTHVSSLVTSVSGDVVVPSTPLADRTVSWLDRFGYDVLTMARSSADLSQLELRGDEAGAHSGFSANPYDAIALGDGRIVVARYGVNPDASAPELQRGDDLVVVGPSGIAQRIDLHADETLAPSACTGAYCVAFARPAVLLPMTAGSTHAIFVLLDRMSADFQHVGTGAVVTLDSATLAVSAPLLLPGLSNCTFASPDPSDPARVIALCLGPRYAPSGERATEDDRRSSAGIVEITLDASGLPTLTARFQPGPADPVPSNGVIALGGGRALYVASGALVGSAPVADRLVDLDLATGTASIVYRASTAFVIQEGVAIAGGALVPDMAVSGILRLSIPAHGPVTITDTVRFDDCVGLPPVQIRPLRF